MCIRCEHLKLHFCMAPFKLHRHKFSGTMRSWLAPHLFFFKFPAWCHFFTGKIKVETQFFLPIVYLCPSPPQRQLPRDDDEMLLVVLLLYESFCIKTELSKDIGSAPFNRAHPVRRLTKFRFESVTLCICLLRSRLVTPEVPENVVFDEFKWDQGLHGGAVSIGCLYNLHSAINSAEVHSEVASCTVRMTHDRSGSF